MTDQYPPPTLDLLDDTAVRAGTDHDAVVDDAVSIIDGALAKMMQRDLVSSGEVADLLLDLRTLLTSK